MNEKDKDEYLVSRMIVEYLACQITADDLYDRGRLMGITESQMDKLIHDFHTKEAWLDHGHLHT